MEKHSGTWSYYAAGGTIVFGGVTLQDLALWVGIAATIGTFIVNVYYKSREDARRARESGDE